MEKSIGDLNASISSSYFYNKKKELNDDKPDEKSWSMLYVLDTMLSN